MNLMNSSNNIIKTKHLEMNVLYIIFENHNRKKCVNKKNHLNKNDQSKARH